MEGQFKGNEIEIEENKMKVGHVLIKERLDADSTVEKESSEESEDVGKSNEKPYKCGVCGRRTTTDTLLNVHTKLHFAKRVHQCYICKQTFNFVTELNSHILTHTEGKSSFQCQICNRICFTEHDLQKHYRGHTTEKSFKCKSCNKHFVNVTYLRIHERAYHGDDYVNKVMKKDGTYVDPRLVQNLNEDDTPKVSVSVPETAPPKELQNDPDGPLGSEEELLLLEKIERLDLYLGYTELERLKICINNTWVKIAELFAEQGYNRNPQKLANTFFQLKHEAKLHIENFYMHRKLPEPRKIDYMFVKLWPTEFQIPGLNR